VTDGTPKLRKAEWIVTHAEHPEAVAFIERTHYAGGAPNTAVARHALRPRGSSEIKGVALWLPPTKPAAVSVAGESWRGVLALSRLCVADDVPKNGASFLLGASMAMLDRDRWPVLLTYADTALGHTGGIYKATNWRCLGEVPGADNWIDSAGIRRGRKRGGRNYSAMEMRELGYTRLPSRPKIKFVSGGVRD
jgi:hypothetical protein